MSRSDDPGNYFQTETSLEEQHRKAAKSTNTAGKPIKLPSKILAIAEDPDDVGRVYVAESAGTARKIVLETGNTSHIFRGPTAPLTCLTVAYRTLFAGCWDKAIWSWDVATRASKRKYLAHTDFVKALLCVTVNGEHLLISGAADASLIVWNINSGSKVHTLKGHTRGIQDLALDPLCLAESSSSTVTVFSAGSDREIRRWAISSLHAAEIDSAAPILGHETSVYKLRFDADDDLWTASADNTVKCLSRERGWQADTTLTHPDFVRDVVVEESGGWVVTACRDEEVRVWSKATGELYHTFTGHFEEVTGLLLVGQTVVSVSIDATVRQWSLKPEDLRQAKVEAQEARKGIVEEEKAPQETSVLTADEEAELAELMEENDE